MKIIMNATCCVHLSAKIKTTTMLEELMCYIKFTPNVIIFSHSTKIVFSSHVGNLI